MVFRRVNPVFFPLILISLIVFLFSCRQRTDPETVAFEFIEQVESAIEDHSIKGLQNLISDSYHDELNRDRQDLKGIASVYLFRSNSVHLFIDIKSIEPLSDSLLRCRLLVAFASTPINDKNLLPRINADCYWFDIEIIEEDGNWKLASAVWQLAMLDDFFSGEPADSS